MNNCNIICKSYVPLHNILKKFWKWQIGIELRYQVDIETVEVF